MKITKYELLGLIKDGKAPKKIKCDSMIWEYENTTSMNDVYWNGMGDSLFNDYYWGLNDEVEILDDEDEFIDIENLHLNNSDVWNGKTDTELIVDKINDLIKNQKKIIQALKENK